MALSIVDCLFSFRKLFLKEREHGALLCLHYKDSVNDPLYKRLVLEHMHCVLDDYTLDILFHDNPRALAYKQGVRIIRCCVVVRIGYDK